MPTTKKPAVLLLEDGTICNGYAFGAIGTTSGEICFNTGMTGYQEVFTDPSYFGQIIIMNAAHIGNYGVKESDVESDTIKISGLIARNLAVGFSRKMANGSLDEYLKKHNLVAIEGIDTRAIVAHIRKAGAMNCIISSEVLDINILKEKLAQTPSMDGLELASKVSTAQAYELGSENAEVKIAVLDFGTKRNILNSLAERGAWLKVFPAKTNLETLKEFNPDGYFISNGPGDPASMDYAVDTIKQIMNQEKPVFGICLGHQLLALANGATTYKLHHGHRGLNHPVRNLQTGKSEITTQNHGFGINPDSITGDTNLEITHINLNDQTIEGVKVKNKNAFSVQYHPESTPGPHDSKYLFDDFIAQIKNSKN